MKRTQFSEIKLVKEIVKRNPSSQLLAKFTEVFEEVADILNNRIPIVFGEYTIHDIHHSVRIMEYMYQLIAKIDELDEVELIVLCYSALLHDIGMAVSKSDLDLIKTNDYSRGGMSFSIFSKIHPTNDYLALQEFFRNIHAIRSHDYILENLADSLCIPGSKTLSFHEEIAKICRSHNESIDWVANNLSEKEYVGYEHFNSQYCGCLLRICDIIDLDDQRTPYRLYNDFIKPEGFSDGEWRQHFVIKNYQKIVSKINDPNLYIAFEGTCDDPKIHRKLMNYFDWVKHEVINCTRLASQFDEKYHLKISPDIQINIKPKGYTFADKKIHVDFRAVTELLTGERLYGNVKYGLRELIQNSIDACNVRNEEEEKKSKFGQKYQPIINIILDPKNNKVTIKDNGIGMSLNIIKNYFLNVGTSYYRSQEFKLKNYNFSPIGNFGIGFLACFMLSDKVTITTRRIGDSLKHQIELEKLSEYTVITETTDLLFEGTEISLDYYSFARAFRGSTLIEVKRFIEENFIIRNIKIEINDLAVNYTTPITNNISFCTTAEKKIIQETDGIFFSAKCTDTGLEGTIGIRQSFIAREIHDFLGLFHGSTAFPADLYFYNHDSVIESYSILQFLPNYLNDGVLICLDTVRREVMKNFSRERTPEWLYRSGDIKEVRSESADLVKAGSKIIVVHPATSLWKKLRHIEEIGLLALEDLPDDTRIEFTNELSDHLTGRFYISKINLPGNADGNGYMLNPLRDPIIMKSIGTLGAFKNNEDYRKTYLKNVLLHESDLILDLNMVLYTIKWFKLNLYGTGIYTNVSREKLIFSEPEKYSILARSIHQGIIEKLGFPQSIVEDLFSLLEHRVEHAKLFNPSKPIGLFPKIK